MSLSTGTFAILTVLLLLLYAYVRFRRNTARYWSSRNIPHLRPVFLLGNVWRANILEHISEVLTRLHLENRSKKAVGFWLFHMPNLLVTDVDIIKRMLIRDFATFQDRGFELDIGNELISEQLALLKGKRWRNLRVRLTPAFTSGKMKMMFPTMMACGRQLEEYLKTRSRVEVKDLFARFTTDVIASCAFGIESNSLQNPNSEFRECGKKILRQGFRSIVASIILFISPKLMKLLGVSIFPKDATEFFLTAIRDTVDYRERTQTTRNDFLQLLVQLMREGKIEDVDKTLLDGMDDEEIVKKFSLHDAAAQCFTFFIAGFENSATVLMFALYELALNPDIQRRLQEELDRIKNDDVTYETLIGLEYLDMVVQETLRKYPPAVNLVRRSNDSYYIPELDATLDKGTTVMVSVTGLHRDPDLYPDPERFDPERFTQEEKARRDTCAFLPFGEGPRNCIGNRFALMQIKVGLASIFRGYNVQVCAGTPVPLVYDKRSFTPAPAGGKMPLVFTPR